MANNRTDPLFDALREMARQCNNTKTTNAVQAARCKQAAKHLEEAADLLEKAAKLGCAVAAARIAFGNIQAGGVNAERVAEVWVKQYANLC